MYYPWTLEYKPEFEEIPHGLYDAADKGDAEAQFQLGLYLDEEDEAFDWLMRAAGQRHPKAQYALACKFYHGETPERTQNCEAAFHWGLKAAEQGVTDAFYGVGEEYCDLGEYDKAIPWFMKALAGGIEEAKSSLAICYCHTGNYKAALPFIKEAAEAGDRWALQNLAEFYSFGRGGLPKDEGKAEELYTKSAEGDDYYTWSLGERYLTGDGIPKDIEKGLGLLVRLAEKDATRALWLGQIYLRGESVPQNIGKGLKWVMNSASRGNDDAVCELAKIFEEGKLVSKNAEFARSLRDKLEVKHERERRGYYHCYRIDCQQDYEEARKVYEEGCKKGNPEAQWGLAELYEKGLGGEQSHVKAILYANAAARNGVPEAQEFLNSLGLTWQ